MDFPRTSDEITVEWLTRVPAVSEDALDLTGTASSKGVYEGRARIAVGDYKFD